MWDPTGFSVDGPDTDFSKDAEGNRAVIEGNRSAFERGIRNFIEDVGRVASFFTGGFGSKADASFRAGEYASGTALLGLGMVEGVANLNPAGKGTKAAGTAVLAVVEKEAKASVKSAADAAKTLTTDVSKVHSKDKQALIEMAKNDKKAGGITEADLQAYKDLNAQLKDPFPENAIHGPEAHSGAKQATSRALHGHVGPVGHIAIIGP